MKKTKNNPQENTPKMKQPKPSTLGAHKPLMLQWSMFTGLSYCVRNHNLPLLEKADDFMHGINLVQRTTSNAKVVIEKLLYVGDLHGDAVKYSF